MVQKLLVRLVIVLVLISCGPESLTDGYMVTNYHISDFEWHENQLYFGAGYCLYQLNPETQQLQTIRCADDKSRVFGRPIIDGDRIYSHSDIVSPTITEDTNQLEAWHIKSKERFWATPQDRYKFSSFKDKTILLDNIIYMAEHDRIQALDSKTGKEVWSVTPGTLVGQHIPFIIHADSLWYTTYDRYQYGNRPRAREVLYRNSLESGETLQLIDKHPQVTFEEVVYVDDEWVIGLGEVNNIDQFVALKQNQLDHIAWHNRIFDQSNVYHIYRYGDLLVSNNRSSATALDITTGALVWEVKFRKANPKSNIQRATIVPLIPYDTYFNQPILYGFDAQTGALVWQHPLETHNNIPLIIEDVVYIGHKNTVDAIDLKNGTLLWRIMVDTEYEYYYLPSG